MPISVPKGGSPKFRFSASFDAETENLLQQVSLERSKHAKAKTDAGIAQAKSTAKSIADQVAAWLQKKYYDEEGVNIPVEAKVYGRFFTIAVTGDASAQKWARIIEVGHGPVNVAETLPTARRKRSLKIVRTRRTKDGLKTYKRGEKDTEDGWYMVVPIVLGRVSRQGDKVVFERNRKTKIIGDAEEQQLNDSPGLLRQFESFYQKTTERNNAYVNSEGQEEDTYYRDGPGMQPGRNVTLDGNNLRVIPGELKGVPKIAKGIHTYETPSYKQQRKGMGTFRIDQHGREKYDREGRRVTVWDRDEHGNAVRKQITLGVGEKLAPGDHMTSRHVRRDAAQFMRKLGIDSMAYRSIDDPNAQEAEDTNDDRAIVGKAPLRRAVSQKGDVVTFKTISNRSKGWVRPARPGKYLLAEAQAVMRRELQAEIDRESRRAHMTIQQQAYVDMLKTML